MCDGYAQSTQHARAVAWLKRGPYLVWLQEDTNAGAPRHEGPKQQQRTGRLVGLQARVQSLRSQFALLRAAVAGAQSRSVEQSPASR